MSLFLAGVSGICGGKKQEDFGGYIEGELSSLKGGVSLRIISSSTGSKLSCGCLRVKCNQILVFAESYFQCPYWDIPVIMHALAEFLNQSTRR